MATQTDLTVASIIQASTSFMILIVTVVVAVTVKRAQKKLARIEYVRDLANAWHAVDTAALADDSVLEIIDLMLDPDAKDDPIEVRRKRWICFMIANPLSVGHKGILDGYSDTTAWEGLKRELRPLARDQVFFDLVQKYHEREFVELCKLARQDRPAGARSAGTAAPPL